MASTDTDDRRMIALRDGFVRALEGATGACGFEARAVWPLRSVCSSSLAVGPQEFAACYAHVPSKHHDTMFDVYCQARSPGAAQG
jgi:hypothetical protein